MGQERVRCPTCGSLAQAADLAAAGSHQIEVRRVLRGLGRGRGFLWSHDAATPEVFAFLHAALLRAIGQVEHMHAAASQAAWLASAPPMMQQPAMMPTTVMPPGAMLQIMAPPMVTSLPPWMAPPSWPPLPSCPECNDALVWTPESGSWDCTRCGLAWPAPA